MNQKKQTLCVFAIGALGYSLIEIAARGHTHWTMALTGGTCFAVLYRVNRKLRKRSTALKCAIGSLFITFMEFGVGLIVNRVLRWDVWDYSDRAFNLLGQICPRFTFYWLLLSLPIVYFSNLLNDRWNGPQKGIAVSEPQPDIEDNAPAPEAEKGPA